MSSKFKNIGKTVKTWRLHNDISQARLAKAIGYKNGQFISNLERGLSSIPHEKILILCEVLNIETEWIVDAILQDHRKEITTCIDMCIIKKKELPSMPKFLASSMTNKPELIYF